jgi:Xaa-Pro aminopeptidase
MKCNEIYQKAIEKSKELQIEDAFLSFDSGKKSYMIGHGIGLELNEPPIISKSDDSQVEDGYVIALDMHMMDENVGVVKLEDMVLITKDGNEILTKSPRDSF